MENMLPGNSFPQICVVSITESVEMVNFIQEYGRSVANSNQSFFTNRSLANGAPQSFWEV